MSNMLMARQKAQSGERSRGFGILCLYIDLAEEFFGCLEMAPGIRKFGSDHCARGLRGKRFVGNLSLRNPQLLKVRYFTSNGTRVSTGLEESRISSITLMISPS